MGETEHFSAGGQNDEEAHANDGWRDGIRDGRLGRRSTVFGLGFDNPDQDARATGQGEAFVAQADDASAIYYNPAGLTQIKGTEFTSGTGRVFFPYSHLEGGGSGAEMNTMATVPHILHRPISG